MGPVAEKVTITVIAVLMIVQVGIAANVEPTRIATAVAVYFIIKAVFDLISYRYRDDPRFAHLRPPQSQAPAQQEGERCQCPDCGHMYVPIEDGNGHNICPWCGRYGN